MDENAIGMVREVFEQWEMYDAVIQHDYMLHQSLAHAIGHYCASRSVSGRAVDLGCGDAWLGSHALRDVPLTEYVGVDLSESALERAASHLRKMKSTIALEQSDLALYLTGAPDASFDLVLASYSLHHFTTVRKQGILADVARILKPNGIFIWSDVVRMESETTETFLGRLTRRMQGEWTGLTERQRDLAVQHVLDSDLPESFPWMRDIAKEVGLTFDTALFEDPCFSAYAFVRE